MIRNGSYRSNFALDPNRDTQNHSGHHTNVGTSYTSHGMSSCNSYIFPSSFRVGANAQPRRSERHLEALVSSAVSHVSRFSLLIHASLDAPLVCQSACNVGSMLVQFCWRSQRASSDDELVCSIGSRIFGTITRH